MNHFPTDLYLILDPMVIPHLDPLEVAQAAIGGGIRMIQYRDKRGSKRQAYRLASGLRDMAREENAVFIINDDLDLALSVGADGVHLGQEDLPIAQARSLLGSDRIVGVSAHAMNQAMAAQEAGADYLGVGPIFPSPTKQARPPLGCEILRELKQRIRIPIFAIGGIKVGNLPEVIRAGTDGVAVASGILGQSDVREATQQFLEALYRIKQAHLNR